MAQTAEDRFLKESEEKAFDLQHRQTLQHNSNSYNLALAKGKSRFLNLENSKKKANLIKWKVTENLDRYLLDFETNFAKRGGKVIWANDAAQAREEIAKIMALHQVKNVVKSKSTATEEIEIQALLSKMGIKYLETDLEQFVAQLMNRSNKHSSTSAGDQITLDTVRQFFSNQYEISADADANAIAAKVHELIHEKCAQADMVITGANFIVSDTGSIVITENEGNAQLATSFAKIHIAVAGIEKVIPSITDLDLFLPLLASHATGQNLTAHNTIFSGPRAAHETDGPEEMYVILLDNGRTNLLAQKEQRQGLYCIRCNACVQVCPVHQHIGGETYATTYKGPIGSLISPHLEGMAKFKHLSEASPLCGKCTEVCPVGIDIQKMLLLNRRAAVQEKLVKPDDKRFWKGFTYVAQRRKLLDFFGPKIKNFILKTLFKKKWGSHREFPNVEGKSFSQQWQDQEKNN